MLPHGEDEGVDHGSNQQTCGKDHARDHVPCSHHSDHRAQEDVKLEIDG